MLGKRRWFSTLLVVVLALVGVVGAAAVADSGSEQGFLSAINSTRASNGLGPLTMNGGLQSHARKHTADMIAANDLYHSSSGELQGAAGSGWSKLGENVGRGGSVSSLHQAFLNSPSHRANILGDYNYVGIGTASSGDRLYVTVVFMKKGSTSSPAPTSTAAPKAAPTTTTTTIPPTTTTTLIVPPDKPVTPGESCYSATRFGWTCHD